MGDNFAGEIDAYGLGCVISDGNFSITGKSENRCAVSHDIFTAGYRFGRFAFRVNIQSLFLKGE